MTVRSITIVRHGRTSYNTQGRIQGWIDIPLDEVGMWQVAQTGKALKDLYVPQDGSIKQLVVASDLSRASQTAHAFADLVGAEVHLDKRLRERHFGQLEGYSMEEFKEQFPEDFESWCHEGGSEMEHGAESHLDCGKRGLEAIREWSHKAGEDTDLFVFSHGAVIENLLQVMLGIDNAYPDFGSMTSMRNAHWARLDKPFVQGEDRWMLVDLNHGPTLADTPLWENPPLDGTPSRA